MELLRRDPDFLFSVVQMSRSLNRKRERSFFPPTVFYGTEKDADLGRPSSLAMRSYFLITRLTASTTISCLRNFLCGFRIWQEITSLGIAWVLFVLCLRQTFGLTFAFFYFPNYKINVPSYTWPNTFLHLSSKKGKLFRFSLRHSGTRGVYKASK